MKTIILMCLLGFIFSHTELKWVKKRPLIEMGEAVVWGDDPDPEAGFSDDECWYIEDKDKCNNENIRSEGLYKVESIRLISKNMEKSKYKVEICQLNGACFIKTIDVVKYLDE